MSCLDSSILYLCNFNIYIFSLLLFIIKNGDHFLSNEVRDISTRYNSDLHLLLANLTLYQKGAFLQQVGFITTCCQLSKTYQMMGNVLKQL